MQQLYLHIIDATGRHYVYNLSEKSVTVLVHTDQFVLQDGSNDLDAVFVQLYTKLLVEKKSLCVLTADNKLMLHADQLTGIQLSRY